MSKDLEKDKLERIYNNISPFEFKDILIDIARKNNHNILDAGRGNPNWLSVVPREAFFIFGLFALEESKRWSTSSSLGGMPKEKGIADRFLNYVESLPISDSKELLSSIYNYGVFNLSIDADEWVFELTFGTLGCNYPVPDRMLVNVEKTVNNYLKKELFGDNTYDSNFDVFATEGGAAAMCYIFNSLVNNKLLNKGDKIAIMTPIFTPYLEIPTLPEYDFDITYIHANEVDKNGFCTYQYSMSEIAKLKDTTIKALFLVNPNNPASIALDSKSRKYLTDVVHNSNPNLMIITDDVYCTFVNNFKSVLSELPYNTLGVYSFSKYFGVTGWRLGTVMMKKNNIFNDLIRFHNEEIKDELDKRYIHMSSSPRNISFIDRMVADSRCVALNHTAGLSTPQQIQMAFFSIAAIADMDDRYKRCTVAICDARKRMLLEGMNVENVINTNDAKYYTEINFLEWAKKEYGDEYALVFEEKINPFDILYSLANEYGVILLNGDGFASSKWAFRVSLANLNDEEYFIIGQSLRNIFDRLAYKLVYKYKSIPK